MRTLDPVNSVLYDCCCPHFLVWPSWQGPCVASHLAVFLWLLRQIPTPYGQESYCFSPSCRSNVSRLLQSCCLKLFAFNTTFQLSSPMGDVEKSILIQNYLRLPQFPMMSLPKAVFVNLVITSGLLWAAEASQLSSPWTTGHSPGGWDGNS